MTVKHHTALPKAPPGLRSSCSKCSSYTVSWFSLDTFYCTLLNVGDKLSALMLKAMNPKKTLFCFRWETEPLTENSGFDCEAVRWNPDTRCIVCVSLRREGRLKPLPVQMITNCSKARLSFVHTGWFDFRLTAGTFSTFYLLHFYLL